MIQLRIYLYILEIIYIIIGKIQSVSKYYFEIIFILKIALSDDLFSYYIEEDNQKITILLKKIKNIYAKFIKRKKLYYFLKYYHIIIRIKAKEMKFLEKNRSYKSVIYIDEEKSFNPFYLSDIDCLKKNINLNNSNNNIQYIDSYPILNSNYTPSIMNSIRGKNYPRFNNKTERIIFTQKTNSKNKNNFKKINKSSNSRSNTMNNYTKNVNFNSLKRFIKNLSINNVNKTEINDLNNESNKKKRTLSYGNLEVKIKRDNNKCKKFNKNKYIFKNCNFISNTESCKEIPSYITSSPNGCIYPTLITNNESSIKNNRLNNNMLCEVTTTISSENSKKPRAKPSLWYCSTFSLKDQISPHSSLSPLPCNNSSNIYSNENTQKYFSNSTNFNSISNSDIFNSKDFLNNQIYNFINANFKSKDNIPSKNNRYHELKRKEKLSNKNNRKNMKIFSKKLSKINHRKENNSYFTMNIDESTQFLSDGLNIDKSDLKTNDKSLENYNVPQTSSVRYINNYTNKSKLISIGTNYIKSPKVYNKFANKYKKKHDLKIDNDYKCNYKPNSNCHTTPYDINDKKNIIIENIKKVKIEYNNKNNNIYNNFSVIYNDQLNSITNNNAINNDKNKESQQSNRNYNKNNNTNNMSNASFNKIYSPKNKYYKKNLSHNNTKINTIKNNNEKNLNNIKNKKNLILQKGKKQFLKNDNVYQHSISFSTLNTNRNHKKLKTHDYEVSHNVVEEQFINKNNFDNNNDEPEEQNYINNDSLTISMQSINDSKILELAKHYIDEEKIIDKGKINEILSDKNTQKIIKNYKYY